MHTTDITPADTDTLHYWRWAVEPDWGWGVAWEQQTPDGASATLQGSLSEPGDDPIWDDLTPAASRAAAYYSHHTNAPFAALRVSASAAGCKVNVRAEGVLVEVRADGSPL